LVVLVVKKTVRKGMVPKRTEADEQVKGIHLCIVI